MSTRVPGLLRKLVECGVDSLDELSAASALNSDVLLNLMRLAAQPAAFLRKYPLTVDLPVGLRTVLNDLAPVHFSASPKALRIGKIAAAHAGHIALTVLVTPALGRGRAERIGDLHAFASEGVDLWVTVQQPGWSVVILDWNGTHHSMVQLRPDPWTPAPNAPALHGRHGGASASARSWPALAMEAAAGNRPRRWIRLRPRMRGPETGRLQVLGIPAGGGGWTFFLQEKSTDNAVLNVSALPWANWKGFETAPPEPLPVNRSTAPL